MRVCVYAASSAELDARLYDVAFRLGELLAEGGDELVYGAGAGGLMGACARGAVSRKGRVTGIAPEFFNKPGVLFDGCTQMIYTDSMSERKARMAQLSEGYIALPGGLGTFDELFETLTLKQIGRLTAPVALVNSFGCYGPLLKMLEAAAEGRFMGRDCMELFGLCDTPEAALEYVRRGAPNMNESSMEHYIR